MQSDISSDIRKENCSILNVTSNHNKDAGPVAPAVFLAYTKRKSIEMALH